MIKTQYIYILVLASLTFTLFNIIEVDIKLIKLHSLNNQSVTKNGTGTKTILYWNSLFEYKSYLGDGAEAFQHCEINNCYITNNRNYVPIQEFDAILFHAPQYLSTQAPELRTSKQRYIFFSHEAPLLYQTDKNVPEYFYNWTMTYWRKSDIFAPYAKVIKRNTNYTVPSVDFLNNKIKLAAWFVSNCNSTPSNRRSYVDRLKNYIDVDIYGSCGTLSCPKENRTNCYRMLENNYLFYLAFENSLCEDYITEKLYYVLQYDIVPIVYGLSNYEILAPPRSFINVADFKTIKGLANYLLYLKNNPNEYLKYLEWKESYNVNASIKSFMPCDLCKKLHQDSEIKTYKDVYTMWNKLCLPLENVKLPSY